MICIISDTLGNNSKHSQLSVSEISTRFGHYRASYLQTLCFVVCLKHDFENKQCFFLMYISRHKCTLIRFMYHICYIGN